MGGPNGSGGRVGASAMSAPAPVPYNAGANAQPAAGDWNTATQQYGQAPMQGATPAGNYGPGYLPNNQNTTGNYSALGPANQAPSYMSSTATYNPVYGTWNDFAQAQPFNQANADAQQAAMSSYGNRFGPPPMPGASGAASGNPAPPPVDNGTAPPGTTPGGPVTGGPPGTSPGSAGRTFGASAMQQAAPPVGLLNSQSGLGGNSANSAVHNLMGARAGGMFNNVFGTNLTAGQSNQMLGQSGIGGGQALRYLQSNPGALQQMYAQYAPPGTTPGLITSDPMPTGY